PLPRPCRRRSRTGARRFEPSCRDDFCGSCAHLQCRKGSISVDRLAAAMGLSRMRAPCEPAVQGCSFLSFLPISITAAGDSFYCNIALCRSLPPPAYVPSMASTSGNAGDIVRKTGPGGTMPIDRKLLDILCCPATGVPLAMLRKDALPQLN